jgi:hypothetical protein
MRGAPAIAESTITGCTTGGLRRWSALGRRFQSAAVLPDGGSTWPAGRLSTVSKDGQWIATDGWIEVSCFGAYTPAIFGRRAWVGEAWFTGKSDLHMIYGPQHTSF